MNRLYLFLSLLIAGILLTECTPPKQEAPNVILIMTDDQGIGDLSCHGNPWLKTPHMDEIYREAVRFTNFHVSPLCTPTRAAIITGQYPINNGSWATFKGRASLHHSSPTLAEVFQKGGYKTGMFGKWHLGDNYPSRPTDCGFDLAIHHGSGGIGEITDYWGNDYFNDVYLVNNQPRKFEGYCTDVWFEESMKFIETHKEHPFFVYLSTNAPHAPLIVDESYARPYQELEGKEIPSANFYGMIANIDENLGKLMDFLQGENLLDNTILIFMTDNGTQFGYSKDGSLGWNKGFKGNKHDKEEGGHRVPFFIQWPEKGIRGGKDINELVAHIDILPTLASMCGIPLEDSMKLDGLDISPLLFGENISSLATRPYFIHHRQDYKAPDDITKSCVAKNEWRLLHGSQLYNIEKDPMHEKDVSTDHPEVVKDLLNDNAAFVQKAKNRFEYQNIPSTSIGMPDQDTAWLTIQHAVGDHFPIYSQYQVAGGVKNPNSKHPLKVEKSGRYFIQLQRWPKESPGPIWGLPENVLDTTYAFLPIQPEKAIISIQGETLEIPIDEDMYSADFKVELKEGKTILDAQFMEGNERYGVYYVYVGIRE